MSWKDWHYWLKGGIIGIFICVIATGAALLFDLIKPNSGHLPMVVVPLILGLLIATLFQVTSIETWWVRSGFIFMSASIDYFLLGAFFGWIVGKIRHKQ